MSEVDDWGSRLSMSKIQVTCLVDRASKTRGSWIHLGLENTADVLKLTPDSVCGKEIPSWLRLSPFLFCSCGRERCRYINTTVWLASKATGSGEGTILILRPV